MTTPSTIPPHKVCVFCGSTDKISNEHVYPKWIGELYKRYEPNVVWETVRDGRTWTTPKLGATVNAVCKRNCNEGWMERLERNTAPLLDRMILTSGKPGVTLSTADQDALLRWTLKTALMADLSSTDPRYPPVLFTGFYKAQEPPAQCAIWVAAYGGNDSGLVTHTARLNFSPPGRTVEPLRGGHLITLKMFRTVLQVFVYDGPPIPTQLYREEPFYERLWPRRTSDVHWPPNDLGFDDETLIQFATQRAIFIGRDIGGAPPF